MSEFGGLWEHENNQPALVPPKTECDCPSGGGIKKRSHTLPLLRKNAEKKAPIATILSVSLHLISLAMPISLHFQSIDYNLGKSKSKHTWQEVKYLLAELQMR